MNTPAPVPDVAEPDFCVLGVGASAGGLNALRGFFSRVPAQPGFACVVVVHLSPEHESHLVQMLQPYTQMPVCQVVKTTAMEPNRVYVIPPNANLNSIDTHLRLSQLEGRRTKRAPIDHFLRTLAETHGERAIGIILSGAGSDGALGIRQIKEHGGLTIAQEPPEAEYGSMPQAAIATGTVDIVLPVHDMAEEVTSYCATQPWQMKGNGALADEEASLLEKILGELRLRTGQEFGMFTREVLAQRISRRMRLHHVSALASYFGILKSHPEEARALHNDLLLNVTEFFRGPEFYATTERVLHEVLERQQEDRVRVWSIGCSTGEEAYSLAMLLAEQVSARDEEPLLQVFASEVAADMLHQAREGVYPQEITASISPERLERFFVHENGRYRVRRELRDLVTFANHDLFKDPPYSHLDVIVCRNLLRDLQPAVRRGALSLFYYSLKPHGILLVDAQDEIEPSDLFTRDPAHPELLRRNSGPRRALELPTGLTPFARASGERFGRPLARESFDTPSLFRRAIERYTPPSVLVNRDNQVVHFSATASRYMQLPGGELTLDIFGMVPGAIGTRLAAGLEHVREGQRGWHSEPFVVFIDGRVRHVRLRIDRTVSSTQPPEYLLVVIEEPGEPPHEADPDDLKLMKLQSELDTVHAQLLCVATSAMGGPAAAEQRQVVEELESAREELQAANEELISVDEENRYRLDALSTLSNDLRHLLESTGFALVLLDCELRITRFTALASEVLRLRDRDIGRPLADLAQHVRYPALIEDLRGVIEQRAQMQIEAESDSGRWYLIRARPYQTALRGLEGVSLLLLDITERKRAELALRESDRRKEEFLAVLAHELRNPLAPIVSGVEVLGQHPGDRALVQQVTSTLARQSKQLVRLVDDLLEVVRINQDKLTLRLERLAVADVVRTAVETARPLLQALEHQLTIEVPEKPPTVEGDAARLTQAIGNLLNNAARYTPAHGRIALRVHPTGKNVEISVHDSGRGLSPESLSKVFEMFYQAGTSGVNSAGLGIGLTLAQKLVHLHGGTIRAESAGVGQGSTFTVTLPLAADEAKGAPAETVPDAADKSGQRHRVLIVDDNTDAAETLRLLMEALGSGEVRTASNGQDALTAGARWHPDLVLLDLGMPDMDGYELARRMRAESWGKEALLVALTGWGQDQHRVRAREAGFYRHMIKPADPEALRAVLNSC